uniref:ribosomal protein S9 n=1 Tax=Galdieria phlegrea TaxID=1389228 RepID=UPI0023D82A9A|nr:ribosomal protein S9 [Galdieria phlegrea]UNJ16238.1 ribosomal protein S9 [Galdieria sp.]WDA99710.1 ribosomal protein S9 [Galdieria sulphuraria]WDA99902.1 ribosomal protein S9 [Galdieria phlegrea]
MLENYIKTGRRKNAIARALIKTHNSEFNNGKIVINGQIAEKYLQYNPIYISKIYLPFEIVNYEISTSEVIVKVKGGGISGQADAIRLAIARILCAINANYKPLLKQYNLLTRDSRIKERRKYGLKKARKAPQYSKR